MSAENIGVFVCTSENMHPYECDGPGKCRHCDMRKDERHDPNVCWLCHDMAEPHPPSKDCEACVGVGKFERRRSALAGEGKKE